MDEDLKYIRQAIIKAINPRKILVFGSVASGAAHKDSDIDICVIEDAAGDKAQKYYEIRKVLGRSIIPLDILIFSKSEFDSRKEIFGTVQFEIDKKGKVLYER